jgi:sarcosine oxidase subunit gamma
MSAWNVQGDPAQTAFVDGVRRLFGIDLPVLPNTLVRDANLLGCWLGPSSWLLVAGGPSPLIDFASKRDALNAMGGALFDVSASRVAYHVGGTRAPAVLSAGCPLDFHPRTFPAGTCRQSLFWRIPALILKADESPTFTLFIARSYARDSWHSLCLSASEYGYEVTPIAPMV